MKKTLKILAIAMCLFVVLTALVACNEECTEHVDTDGNLKCDNCGADMSQPNDDNGDDVPCNHDDYNLDEKCDLCNADMPLNDGLATYSVQVSNGVGGGYGDFIVEFLRNGNSVAVKRTDKDGYVYVRLSQAKYTITLVDTQDRGLVYDVSTKELTSTVKSLVIVAANDANNLQTTTIMGADMNVFTTEEAYAILGEGSYSIDVETSKIVPIVWVAKYAGVYTFTFQSEVGVKMTQHGIPAYVQAHDTTDEKNRISDESFKITIYSFNLANSSDSIGESTPFVIGIKANVIAGNGILKIEKTAETPPSHYDVPWTENNSILPGEVPFGSELTKNSFTYVKLDGTDKAVFNPNDGLYHLNSADGKVLYIQLKYTPATLPDANSSEGNLFSFEALVSNGAFRVERLDGNQEVISKIDYTAHLNACLEKVNALDNEDNRLNNAGTYYLTESMIEGLKDYGDYNGWWKESGNIFGESLASINPEYAWMFAVCYLA
ncbi:MAG: hypothetical protein IKL86_03815 [Clostridia bacterium]|nr:hypothetical protein [Clostridia bacterium]